VQKNPVRGSLSGASFSRRNAKSGELMLPHQNISGVPAVKRRAVLWTRRRQITVEKWLNR
jgi:hypothetical protein